VAPVDISGRDIWHSNVFKTANRFSRFLSEIGQMSIAVQNYMFELSESIMQIIRD
jgi:hypothetical protein